MAKTGPQPLDDAEADQLDQALKDVAFQLTHKPSDTCRDLRDAVAFAPIAAVKGIGRLVDGLVARPRRIWIAAGVGVLLLVAGAVAVARKAR